MIGGAFLILAVSAILIVCLWADKYDDYPDTASRPPPLALKDASAPQSLRRGPQKRGFGLQEPQRGLQKRGSAPQAPHGTHPRRGPVAAPQSAPPNRRLKYWEIEDMEAEAAEARARGGSPPWAHPPLPRPPASSASGG